MCECSVEAATTHAMAERRTVLKLTAAVIAGIALLPDVLAKDAKAQGAKAPPKPGNVLSPDAALDRLMKGNARYVEGVSKRHDFSHEREPLRTGQNPFAGVLSCADSRIAPEYCFDTSRGDIFVCRVAGNFASDENIASFEYAVQVLNTPLILVLGHDACGAVDATAKSIKDGTTLPGHLPALVAALSPAVKAVQGEPGVVPPATDAPASSPAKPAPEPAVAEPAPVVAATPAEAPAVAPVDGAVAAPKPARKPRVKRAKPQAELAAPAEPLELAAPEEPLELPAPATETKADSEPAG